MSIDVQSTFQGYIERQKIDNLTAAILTLSEVITEKRLEVGEDLGHEICMGIRHGLFGREADDKISINNTLEDISQGILQLGESIRDKKD
jgi:hypothetical protein